MYRYFYGINDFPFGACPDPRFVQDAARSGGACLPAIRHRFPQGFVVMTGEVGTGKDIAEDRAQFVYRAPDIEAFVFNPRLDVLDFLEFVLADFGIPRPSDHAGMPQTKSGMLMQRISG